MIDVEEHNGLCLLIFSMLSIFFFAAGAYLTSSSTPIDNALGYASYAAGGISILADVYTGIVRLIKHRVTPILRDAQKWAVEEIKNPIISTVKSVNKISLAIAAANSGRTYEEIKGDVQRLLLKMEEDKEFWNKYT